MPYKVSEPTSFSGVHSMIFELTEEQNLIRDMVREFAVAEVAPQRKNPR